MSSLLKDKRAIGGIIARMQVPYLTESHKATIQTVFDRHTRVVIFLGVNNDGVSEKNPYSFDFRKEMIKQSFPDNEFNIIPLPDNNNDNAAWVNQLDRLTGAFLNIDETAVLYGGRDSFIPHYKKDNGLFECIELAPNDYDSGTDLRLLESIKSPKYSRDSAQAILWAIRNKR
jgi:hypothetical protein